MGITKGASLKTHWLLQIPLHWQYHYGDKGIDAGYGVVSWERDFETQIDHLRWVSRQLGYDVLDLWKEKQIGPL